MARVLRNLVIDRIDLVDKGANPGAHVVLFKRGVSKMEPMMFDDAVLGRRMHDLYEELGILHGALYETIDSIMRSEASDKRALLAAAVKEFTERAQANVPALLEEVVAKIGTRLSADRLARLVQAKAQIQEACLICPEAKMADTKTIEATAVEKRLVELEKALNEERTARQTSDTALAAERDGRITKEFVAICKAHTHLPLAADTDARLFKRIAEKDPEAWARVQDVLTKVNAQLKASSLFQAIGAPGSPDGADDAPMIRIDKLVRAKMEKHDTLSYRKAFDQVLADNPVLAAEWRLTGKVLAGGIAPTS